MPGAKVNTEVILARLRDGMPYTSLSLVRRGGLFGYTERHLILACIAGKQVEIGSLSMGGESQNGTCLVVLTGKGCGLVADWHPIALMVVQLKGKISRLDLACDFLNGEHTVDDAVAMLKKGEFVVRGRQPGSRLAGDWLDGMRGRTLYIGSGKNGKMLRVYERGVMLGDLSSPWVRYEVQFLNRDRVIPLDALINPDPYFAGAYPALAQMLPVAAIPISTKRKEAHIDLSHRLKHLKHSYGATIAEAMATTGASEQELVNLVSAATPAPSQHEPQLDWRAIQVQVQK
jgi:phage replication initiation protein